VEQAKAAGFPPEVIAAMTSFHEEQVRTRRDSRPLGSQLDSARAKVTRLQKSLKEKVEASTRALKAEEDADKELSMAIEESDRLKDLIRREGGSDSSDGDDESESEPAARARELPAAAATLAGIVEAAGAAAGGLHPAAAEAVETVRRSLSRSTGARSRTRTPPRTEQVAAPKRSAAEAMGGTAMEEDHVAGAQPAEATALVAPNPAAGAAAAARGTATPTPTSPAATAQPLPAETGGDAPTSPWRSDMPPDQRLGAGASRMAGAIADPNHPTFGGGDLGAAGPQPAAVTATAAVEQHDELALTPATAAEAECPPTDVEVDEPEAVDTEARERRRAARSAMLGRDRDLTATQRRDIRTAFKERSAPYAP